MKLSFILLVTLVFHPAPFGGTQHIVSTAGFTFSPPTLTVSAGDTVIFSLSFLHNALEVAESTWNVNGDLALPGGFSTPFGGGSVVMNDTGTHFYICEAHIGSGMKGKIIVNPPAPPVTSITINSIADRDGLTGTTADRIAKPWSLKLYQDSVGSGLVLDSVVSAATLTVTGLAAGTYVAAEADSAVSILYPAAVSPAYIYEAGYSSRLSIADGPGYWIKFVGTQAVNLTGLIVDTDTLPVQQGWNIVGSVSAPVAAASLQSIPPGLVTSSFFGYELGYYNADTIKPGRGYWVKASAPGSIVISSAPGAAPVSARVRIESAVELPPSPPDAGRTLMDTPGLFALRHNYPNPFNPATRVAYSLDGEARVKLSVYNLIGERVATLVDAVEGPGDKTSTFDGSGLPGGVYIIRIVADGKSQSIKVILVK